MSILRLIYVSIGIALLTSCTPIIHPAGGRIHEPQLTANAFITADDAHLPLRRWLATGTPNALLVAVHGFNDYSQFFEQAGQFLSKQGINCFAYDQRGFGRAPKRGLWAGAATYRDDLEAIVSLLKNQYPDIPIYLLGESMGGAVVMTLMSEVQALPVAGIVLSAPALWARSTMPWYQTSLLWTMAHTLPWFTLTGKGVGVKPSDNIPMLRALGRDPMIIKETRVESIYGLANLMDEAYASATHLQSKSLLLYGEKDEIIPKQPTFAFLKQWLATTSGDKKVAIYEQGYHMLLRDLHAEKPWQDIATWIKSHATQLPSGADRYALQSLAKQSTRID